MWPFTPKQETPPNTGLPPIDVGGKGNPVNDARQPVKPTATSTKVGQYDYDYNYNYDASIVTAQDVAAAGPHRIGVAPALRIPLISGVSFLSGFGIGSAVGATNSGLRYRAENAHNVPTSQAGWYLYNKSKNYHVLLGGVGEGIKNGARYAGWTALFLSIEEGLDRARGKVFANKIDKEEGRLARGQRDFLNTLSAAIALSGIYGWWHQFDQYTAARMTKRAVKYALPFGLAQDMLASLKGEGPWYVQMLLGKEQIYTSDKNVALQL